MKRIYGIILVILLTFTACKSATPTDALPGENPMVKGRCGDGVCDGPENPQNIQAWDDMLAELIDPLVAEGYLQWTSVPEMGQLYLEWEVACHEGR